MKQADRQLLVEAEAVCVDAARQAGAVLLGYFRSQLQVEFKEKGQQSPVTNADRQSEELRRAALINTFPDHGIIGEEGYDGLTAPTEVSVNGPMRKWRRSMRWLPLFRMALV